MKLLCSRSIGLLGVSSIILIGFTPWSRGATNAASISSPFMQIRGIPILWIGDGVPPEEETAAVIEAQKQFQAADNQRDTSAFEQFIANHSNSGWNPSVRAALGFHYRSLGRYTLAIERWQAAWDATKFSKNSNAAKTADYTIANYTQLLASLGRVETLKVLFKECDQRRMKPGPLANLLKATRDAAATMELAPERCFKCGTYALHNVAIAYYSTNRNVRALQMAKSPPTGFSMARLLEYCRRYNLDFVAAAQDGNIRIVVPSVVHWQQNHYAAIVDSKTNKNGRLLYKVIDPTFSSKTVWMTEENLIAEASGRFIVPRDCLPGNWRQLAAAECDTIFGKGWYHEWNWPPPQCPDENDPEQCCEPNGSGGGGPGGGGGCGKCLFPSGPVNTRSGDVPEGMPRWSVEEPDLNLNILDVPMAYRPAVGSRIAFSVNWRQRWSVDPNHEPTASQVSVGNGWHCSWISYIDFDTGNYDNFWFYSPGGGFQAFGEDAGDGRTSGYYDFCTYKVLTEGTNDITGYEIDYNGGAKAVYRYKVVTTDRFMLSERVDRAGRSSKFLATVQHLNGDKADAWALRATWEKSFGAKAALGTAGPMLLAAQAIKVRRLAHRA